jgi:hypothetical protein
MFRTFLIHLSCLRLQPVGTQPVLQAIQLGTADSSARFRVKTVGVVEKALGVDKEVTARHFGPLAEGERVVPAFERKTARAEQLSLRGGQIVWPDLPRDRRDDGRLALA